MPVQNNSQIYRGQSVDSNVPFSSEIKGKPGETEEKIGRVASSDLPLQGHNDAKTKPLGTHTAQANPPMSLSLATRITAALKKVFDFMFGRIIAYMSKTKVERNIENQQAAVKKWSSKWNEGTKKLEKERDEIEDSSLSEKEKIKALGKVDEKLAKLRVKSPPPATFDEVGDYSDESDEDSKKKVTYEN